MAIAIYTSLSSEQGYNISRERETKPLYPHILMIDPEGIIEQPKDYNLKMIQGRENVSDEALSLHTILSNLTGLLANSPHLAEKIGSKQLVRIVEYKEARETVPHQPIAVDLLQTEPSQTLPPLFTLALMNENLFNLPVLSLEFFPKPKLVPGATIENQQIILRNARIGERRNPIFYGYYSLPLGIGRLDSGFFNGFCSLLTYSPAEEFQISPEAVQVLDNYADLQGRIL